MINIREAISSDSSKITRVHVDTWKITYRGIVPQLYLDNLSYKDREERWIRILNDVESIKSNKSFTLVAETEMHDVIGFASAGKERSGDGDYHGELYSIYILENWQRKGIGQQLVKEALLRLSTNGFPSMQVWVLKDNPSRAFYEVLGGKLIRERPITIGGAELLEVAYGWININDLLARLS